ncbi:DDE_Tnp_1 domain-containing protein [Azospirillaceae bacterium]
MASMEGIIEIAGSISAEFQRLLPKQRKTQRENLSLLVATMLLVRSANLMALAAGLPRAVERIDMRYQWIARVLSNPLIEPDVVMAPFIREILSRFASKNAPIVLIMDQSKLSDRHQVLMLAVRYENRVLPLLWRVEEIEGTIGFSVQKELLNAASSLLPQDAVICLMADRFYGTADLISLCQEKNWDYRLRLRGNLAVRNGEERTITKRLAGERLFVLENMQLTEKRATTNIGVIHDPGCAEPWIIATPSSPGYLATLRYSERWGIELMFSDFKSCGFGIEDTQIQYPDRLARLILVMAIALYVAVSTGQWDEANNPAPAEKNT